MGAKGASAIQVWTQVPVASRTVTVNDKTSFSLTAGSYSVRASSSQYVTGDASASTAQAFAMTISSVTLTRAAINHAALAVQLGGGYGFALSALAATTVTVRRRDATSAEITYATQVSEYF